MTPSSRGVRTGSAGGLFLYICVVHGLGRVVGSIATSFDEDMSLRKLVVVQRERESGIKHLQGVFSGETLVATGTWEGFDSQVNPFMTFQIVIAVKTLRTLIAFERSVLIVDDHAPTSGTH